VLLHALATHLCPQIPQGRGMMFARYAVRYVSVDSMHQVCTFQNISQVDIQLSTDKETVS
jgi:hypothetical protein